MANPCDRQVVVFCCKQDVPDGWAWTTEQECAEVSWQYFTDAVPLWPRGHERGRHVGQIRHLGLEYRYAARRP